MKIQVTLDFDYDNKDEVIIHLYECLQTMKKKKLLTYSKTLFLNVSNSRLSRGDNHAKKNNIAN